MIGERYPWQREQWNQIARLEALDRLPHGLLFAGPGEIGKHEFALAVAKFLLCLSPVEGDACHRCKTCQLFEAHSHPDFYAVEPEDTGKAIRVDQVRALAEFSAKTAAMGGRRVIALCPAEAMNINAANALLKTLEEPGKDVVIILVTHQPGRLLATIRSRCRLFPFTTPPQVEVLAWLNARTSEASDVEQVMSLSGGRPLRALRLLESELGKQRQEFQQTLAGFEDNQVQASDAARVLQGLAKTDALEWFQYRVYGRIKTDVTAGSSATPLLFRFLDKLTLARQRLLSTANPNPQLVWEEVLMDWKSVINFNPQR